jgi:ribosome-binding ATPase YchF (GTP1/OBG family)
MIRIGLIGKTNTGKTTFFNAATLLSAEVSNYPFTTKHPNYGVAQVQSICVCRELHVQDNPRNSICMDGWRFIPVEIVDLPGLIKGSWMGRGLGTQFLSVAAQADALLHIVDASGSVDAEGRLTRPGMGNPVIDVYDIEDELVRWFGKIIEKAIERAVRVRGRKVEAEQVLYQALAGMKVKLNQIQDSLRLSRLESKELDAWDENDILDFSKNIRQISKPTIVIANKMDLPFSERNYERLSDEFGHAFVIPVSSEAELALRRAAQKGFVKYLPGEENFRILHPERLTADQMKALSYVQQRVFSKWIHTGLQFALNTCVFKLLNMNTVYPVEDEINLADKKGNVLPDAYLVSHDSTVRDLAEQIHTELARTMSHAIDARTGLRLPANYILKDRDVIKIVSAARRRERRH